MWFYFSTKLYKDRNREMNKKKLNKFNLFTFMTVIPFKITHPWAEDYIKLERFVLKMFRIWKNIFSAFLTEKKITLYLEIYEWNTILFLKYLKNWYKSLIKYLHSNKNYMSLRIINVTISISMADFLIYMWNYKFLWT